MADELFFNGIDATTGDYLLPAMGADTLSKLIQGQPVDKTTDKELAQWYERLTQGHYGIKEGLDPKNLAESGWGVIFAFDEDQAVIDALKPLLDWRQTQAAAENEVFFKVYTKGEGLRPNENKNAWLARHGAGPGPADPANVPYYLMLVGSPEKISYRFQTQLDVQYAVGRIYFDTVEEYANYAKSVVEAEKQQLKLPRKLAFFGSANNDDPATNLSSNQLVAPLVQTMMDKAELAGWDYATFLKDQATKNQLGHLLGGDQTPALLFTATHGMSYPNGHPLQLRHNGSLLTQDWPGPRQWRKEISDDFYFSGDDLASDQKLWGLISFFFACYGAGTPMIDEFAQQAFKNQRAQIAPKPFISKLPQKMLSHPNGGALAVLGHVERAWGYSFMWGKANRQLAVFESTLQRLMEGHPVGSATEYLNQRYAELSTLLSDELEEVSFGKVADDLELSGMWTANNDARNYVVLGDPAVRMMVAETGSGAPSERPSISLPVVADKPVAFDAAPAEAAPVMAAPVPEQPVVAVEAVPAAPVPSNGGSKAAPAILVPTSSVPAVVTGEVVDGAAVNYGLNFDQFGDSLKALGQNIGKFLSDSINKAVTLRVETYTSENISQVEVKPDGTIAGANLRALTVVEINGNIRQVVPVSSDSEVDESLWNLHMQTVAQAEQARSELIKSAISAASSLIGAGK
jgi:hypothetical protein